MKKIELGEVQTKFAEIVWEKEPIQSGELVKICDAELNWKKSTTYTVLHKLCEKGILQNNNGIVTSKMSREEYYQAKGKQMVHEYFDGSIPAFLAAFTRQKVLTVKDVNEIQALIDKYREDNNL